MAIKAKAVKGGIKLASAYIVVTSAKMEKFLRPTLDENNNFAGNVVSVQYSAKAEIYSCESERVNDYGSTPFSTFFVFDHVDGEDIIKEAYAKIYESGIPGWLITNMAEV